MNFNGTEIFLEKSLSVKALLEQKGYRTDRIAVELNGTIVPKTKYGETVVTDQDAVEVVSFVGGG